jgi:mRNA-degrading endonuclease YafQ of YafQ-DinJ toxin-antitoxin module
VPTYETLSHFLRDWKNLTAEQKRAFLVAVAQLVADLKTGNGIRRGLRVKKMQGFDSVWEMSWAPDGRATFHYGESIKDGEHHIVWRRIGTHSIFNRP